MTSVAMLGSGTATIWRSIFIACVLWSPSSLGFVGNSAFSVQKRATVLPSTPDGDLMESLKARQLELESRDMLRYSNWKTAKCESSIPIALPDWVRRIDYQHPLVACGSSSGTIFLAHVETGEILARSETLDVDELDDIEGTLRMLFGAYDGGGTLAVTMDQNRIFSSDRRGSVQTHCYDKASDRLVSQGSMKALEGVLVTCLALDEDYLWVGTADGRVLAYSHSEEEVLLLLQTTPALEFNAGSPILSLSLETSIGYGIATTAKGSVELFSMEDDDRILVSWYPSFDSGVTRQSSNTYPLTAALVMTKDGGYCMACGASDGSLFLQPLNWESERLDEDKPLRAEEVECKPKHQGPVKCLVSPRPNLLVSGGHDGVIRTWDVSERICLYQLMGYKVWLGSLCSDGTRLVSDGADNTVVVHNFDAEQQQDRTSP